MGDLLQKLINFRTLRFEQFFKDRANKKEFQPSLWGRGRIKNGMSMNMSVFFRLEHGQFTILHKNYNAPCLPPKILHNHCFGFLLG